MADFDHLLALGFSTGLAFKSNLKVVPQEPPQRERQAHGEKLLRELARLRVDAEELNNRRAQLGLNEATGMTIVLEISPPGSLDLSKKLEWRRDGIEALSSNLAGGTEVVALYVPDGKEQTDCFRLLRGLIDYSDDMSTAFIHRITALDSKYKDNAFMHGRPPMPHLL